MEHRPRQHGEGGSAGVREDAEQTQHNLVRICCVFLWFMRLVAACSVWFVFVAFGLVLPDRAPGGSSLLRLLRCRAGRGSGVFCLLRFGAHMSGCSGSLRFGLVCQIRFWGGPFACLLLRWTLGPGLLREVLVVACGSGLLRLAVVLVPFPVLCLLGYLTFSPWSLPHPFFRTILFRNVA